MENLLPVLNMDLLQEKANEAAMKGALAAIEDYYTGYESPFKKAIRDQIISKESGNLRIDLPDVVSLLNDALAKEMDIIANKAVSKTFVPLVSELISRTPKQIKFSEFLAEFGRVHQIEDIDSCSCYLKEDEYHGWINLELSFEGERYCITLHKDWDSRNKTTPLRRILSMPHEYTMSQKMNVSLDGGATLELPMVKSVFEDRFLKYIANLILNDTLIEMDCDDFEESMFFNY